MSTPLAHVDNAHTVREVIDNPHLCVRTRCNGDRLKAYRDGIDVREPALADPEYLDPVIRCVDGEEMSAIRRQRERADLPALEQGE